MDSLELNRLVRRASRGDREAFGELVSQFEPMVFRVVLQRLRNRSEACEVTQDVFLQAMRKLPQLRDPDRFGGWLRQIAVRMTINRAVRRPMERVQHFASGGPEESVRRTPLEDMLRNEQADELRSGLNRLRELDRNTLIAFYFEGHSLKEMSDRFDSPVGTIKRRLHTARSRLRDELAGFQPA